MTRPAPGIETARAAVSRGKLIINADDWGREIETTDKTLDCVLSGAVSSVSAMVFMNDSVRAAAAALEREIEAGLHLNFTTGFSAPGCSARLKEHQQRLGRYLLRRRFAQVVFHPGLMNSFEYVVSAQLDEFHRLYGRPPQRIDGHHHMHLCANVLFQGLLPQGTLVRRNFTFQAGERTLGNRLYRGFTNGVVARNHRLVDYFFSLAPLEPRSRLRRIFSLALDSVVEVETHPIERDEYRFLLSGEMQQLIDEGRK
jgi:predicted glycoside hydrolase/deacetylase ChbG (UPF0249 family)